MTSSELEPRRQLWGQVKESGSQSLDSEVTKRLYVPVRTGAWGLGSQRAWRDEGRSREGTVRMVRRSRRQKLQKLTRLCRQEEGLRVRG